VVPHGGFYRPHAELKCAVWADMSKDVEVLRYRRTVENTRNNATLVSSIPDFRQP
jgi:hypothetical protein